MRSNFALQRKNTSSEKEEEDGGVIRHVSMQVRNKKGGFEREIQDFSFCWLLLSFFGFFI